MKFAYYKKNNINEFVFVPMDDMYQDDDGNIIDTPYEVVDDITSEAEVKKALDEFVEVNKKNYVTNKSRVVINGISGWRYRHVHWRDDGYGDCEEIEDEVLLIPVQRDTDEVPKRIIPYLYMIEWIDGDKTPLFAFSKEDAIKTYNLNASSIKDAKRVDIGMSLKEEGLTYNPFSGLRARKLDL